MADGGLVIGRVSIKAVPNTKDYRADLLKALRRIENTVEANIAATIDEKQLERSARLAIKDINAKSAARAAGMVIKIRAEIDEKDLDSRIRDIVRQANRELKIDVDTDPAIDSFDRMADSIEQRSDGMARAVTNDSRQMVDDIARATTRMDEELRELGRKRSIEFRSGLNEHDLRRVNDQLDDLHDKWDGKDINFHPDLAQVAYRTTQAQMALLSRDRWIQLKPVVESKSYAAAMTAIAALSGARMINETLSNLRRMFENLDKNIPLIGSIATAIAGLSAWLLAAASNSFALARSLAQMAGAGLALPGILTGMVFGVGALVAVLKDFNTVMPEVGAALGSLQNQMSANFWDQALAPMREAVAVLFPEFARGMEQTATTLGVAFGSLAMSLRTHLAGEMTPMFEALNASIVIAAGATDDIGASIEILGRHGSKYLPRFADWFREIAAGFRSWLDEADRTGRLNEIIETGITQVKEFGRVVANASSILTSLAKAAEAAGGSTLTMFADTLERVADVMRGVGFQTGMIKVFEAAHTAMSEIVGISGPAFLGFWTRFADMAQMVLIEAGRGLGEAIAGVGEALNNDAFDRGLEDFFSGIANGIAGLAPMWESLGAAIGTVGTIVGTMASEFGPILGELLLTISELVVRIGPEIQGVVESLAGMMSTLVATVTPALGALIEMFVMLVTPILNSEVAVGLLVAAFAAMKFNQAWTAISGWFATMQTSIGKATAGVTDFHKGLSKTAKVGSAAIAVLAGLSMLGSAIQSSTGEAVPALGRYRIAIEDYSKALDVLEGPTHQSTQSLTALQDVFARDIGDGWFTAIADLDYGFTGLSDTFDKFQDSTKGWGSIWNSLATGLGMAPDLAGAARESFDQFDSAVAQMVSEGNLKAAEDAVRSFTEAGLESGMKQSEISALLDDYNLALEEYTTAQEIASAAATAQNDAMANYSLAIASANGMTPQLAESIRGAAQDFIDLTENVDDSSVSLGDWITGLEEQAAAYGAWADNMAILTERGVSQGVLAELQKLGPEGALRVQELTTATDEELARLESVMGIRAGTAVANANGQFALMDDGLREELNKLSPEAQAILSQLGIEMGTHGQNVTKGFAMGMDEYASWSADAATRMANGVAKATTGVMQIHSPSRLMKGYGGNVAQGFANGISEGQSLVSTAISVILGAVQIPNPSDILYNAGSTVISGFISGISRGFDRVKTTLGSLTAMLPDWKGPAETDATILYNAGELVIGGFVDGLRDHFGDVKDVLGDLTDELEKADIGELPFEANAVASLSQRAAARYADSRQEGGSNSNKTLIYNAAPGSSLGAEEDLFAAMNRGRSGW